MLAQEKAKEIPEAEYPTPEVINAAKPKEEQAAPVEEKKVEVKPTSTPKFVDNQINLEK